MLWSETYLRDLGARLAEAKRQGLWISARDVEVFREILQWVSRVSTTGWRRPHEGALPTVGDARAQGITHVYVSCTRRGCVRSDRKIAFDDLYMPPGRLPLPDHAAFLDIPNLCRFRCVQCGSRRVRMMPAWPHGPGMGGAHGQARSMPVASLRLVEREDDDAGR